MTRFKFILFISLSLTGINFVTLGISESISATITLFKFFSVFYFFLFVPTYIFSKTRLSRIKSNISLSKNLIYSNFLFILFLCMILLNASNIIFTSFINLIFFLIMFLVLFKYLENLTIDKYFKVLKYVINIYFYVTVIGVFFYYIVNVDFLTFTYAIQKNFTYPHFQGLATEASHAAFIVLSSYLVYTILSRRYHISMYSKVHYYVLFMVLFFQSTFGYILYVGIVIYIYSEIFSKYRSWFILIILALLIVTNNLYIEYFVKLHGLYELITTLDYAKANYAAVRTMGFIMLIEEYGTLELFYQIFGHGVGTSKEYIIYISNGLFTDGQFASFLYDYGILGSVLIFTFIFLNLSKRDLYISLFILILLIFNANISSQMYWWVLLMLFSLKIFRGNYTN